MSRKFKSLLLVTGLLMGASASAQPIKIGDILIDAQGQTAKVVASRNGVPLVIPTGAKPGTQASPADLTVVGVAKGCTDDQMFCVDDTVYDNGQPPKGFFVAGILPGNRLVYREKGNLIYHNAGEKDLGASRGCTADKSYCVGSKVKDAAQKPVTVVGHFINGDLVILDQANKISRSAPGKLHPQQSAVDPNVVNRVTGSDAAGISDNVDKPDADEDAAPAFDSSLPTQIGSGAAR